LPHSPGYGWSHDAHRAGSAILLSALAGVDARDSATADSVGKATDYTKFLDPNGLKGARFGIARKYFGLTMPWIASWSTRLMRSKKHEAVIVDPADLESHGKLTRRVTVLLYELKADLNVYLAAVGSNPGCIPEGSYRVQ